MAVIMVITILNFPLWASVFSIIREVLTGFAIFKGGELQFLNSLKRNRHFFLSEEIPGLEDIEDLFLSYNNIPGLLLTSEFW